MNSLRDPQTHSIIGAAMEVHRLLGNGFLEAVYQEAFALELSCRSVEFLREVELKVFYKGSRLNTSYRADFICFKRILIELKAQRKLTHVDEAQVINYLRATGFQTGLLLNFGAASLEVRRFINSKQTDVAMTE